MKLLVIEDDTKIVEAITITFQAGWPDMKVVSANWGQEGVEMVEAESPNVIIVDLGLPDIPGLEVIKRIRSFSDVPILVLSVNEDEIIVVQAFELGASDYVFKPFRPMELIARVKRLMVKQYEAELSNPVMWGSLVFDPSKREVIFHGKKIELRAIESTILENLIKKAPEVVSYNTLAQSVWGDDYLSSTDCLKVHVRHLREKLESDPSNPKIIRNKSGTGYYALKPE